MKKFLTILLAAILAVSGCRKYDDSHVWDELFDLAVEQQKQAKRLAALEAWQATVNDNIWALQTVVGALENNDYVTAVTPFDDPAPGGYYIDFSKSGRATIKNGEKGDTGDQGDKGADGATPQIGVAQYPDDSGVYYWTLNGDWLLDDSGEKIPVTGEKGDKGDTGDKGDQGDKGDTGNNGITPKLRINASTNEWEVCTNGTCAQETDWVSLGIKATGAQGEKGEQGDAIFAEDGVKYYDNDTYDYVEFTLAGGGTIQVPKYRPLGITLDPYGVFAAHGATQDIGFTYTGDVQSITPVNVPSGWTVSEVTFNHGDKQGTFTVTAPADNGKYYTAAGTATLLVSDGKERTITAPLALECPPYVAPPSLDIRFAENSYTIPAFKNGNTKAVEFTTTAATSVTVVDVPQGWTVSVTHDAATGAGTFSITAPADGLRSGTALALASGDGGKTAGLPLALTLEPVDSGSAGSSCSWTLTGVSGSYTLTISGSGTMPDYNLPPGDDAPWDTYRNNIKTVVIADGVTNVGNGAFAECSGLTAVTIGNSVTHIGDYAFYNCSLTAVTIPNSVTNISNGAFYYCRVLTAVTIGNSVTTIGDKAFYNCDVLTAVTIPNSVTTIGNEAFYNCSGLREITIPNSVTTIGNEAFTWCTGLTAVTIGNSVETIGEQAFDRCSGLTAVTIGNAVRIIGNGAFTWCTGLREITIPNSVTTIDEWAFAGCSALREITSLNPVPQSINANVFYGVTTGNITLKAPANAVAAYKAAAVWKDFGSYIPIYDAGGLDISFTQPAAFTLGQSQDIAFTTAGYIYSITAVDVPRGWTVSAATFSGSANTGTFTVTPPAADAKHYTASGTATLIVSDGAERSITKPLALECPPYVAPAALGIDFTQPAPFCAGAIQDVEFTTTGNATTVKALDVPAGWAVQVQFDKAAAAGTFTVTAPSSGGSDGEAVILVSDASGKTVMRTLGLTARDVFTAGAIATTGQTICYGSTPGVINSSTAASGGDDDITYEWRHNDSPIGNTNSAAYTPAAYNTTVGAHTFTRWAHDGACNTDWVQSTGSWVLTIRTLPTITLASGSTAQTVTAGSSITPVIYTTANATDASASDLPAGVTGSWDTNTYTINGTPTYANTYNYTVTPTNTGCTNTTATGTITVNCSNCAEWTTCNGFTQISNVSYENNKTMDFWTGKFYCENKGTGWRLPTKDELICMCNNRDALPGGYVYNGDYWSDEYYWRYYVINFGGCWDNTPGTSHSYYIKCVK